MRPLRVPPSAPGAWPARDTLAGSLSTMASRAHPRCHRALAGRGLALSQCGPPSCQQSPPEPHGRLLQSGHLVQVLGATTGPVNVSCRNKQSPGLPLVRVRVHHPRAQATGMAGRVDVAPRYNGLSLGRRGEGQQEPCDTRLVAEQSQEDTLPSPASSPPGQKGQWERSGPLSLQSQQKITSFGPGLTKFFWRSSRGSWIGQGTGSQQSQ